MSQQQSVPVTKLGSDTDEKLEDSPGSVLDPEAKAVLHWRSWMIPCAGAMFYFGAVIVVTAAGFWLATIEADIGGVGIGLWLSQALQMVNAVIGPALSRLGDSCGRRYIILGGHLAGIMGSIVIATSNSMNVAVLGSALFGFCWGLIGNVFTASSESVTRRHRPIAQVIASGGGAFGVYLAEFGGAGLIRANPGGYPGWRSLFFIGAATLAVSAAMFAFLYHPEPPPNPKGLTIPQRILAVDPVGCFLYAAALLPLLIGCVWGGAVYPWTSAAVLAPLVTGCVFVFICAVHQVRFKKDGLFSHAMFKKRNASLALFGLLVEGMIYIVFNVFYGRMTALLFDRRPFALAARFSTFQTATNVGIIYCAWHVYKFKEARGVLIAGYVLFLAAVVGLATVQPHSDLASIAYCALAGLGFSAPITQLTVVAQLAVPKENMGNITSLLISARSAGGAIGSAIAGAVYRSKLAGKLPAYIAAAVLGAGLPATSVATVTRGISTSNATLANSAPGMTQQIFVIGVAARQQAYADSLRFIWIVLVPFLVVALVGCFFFTPIKDQMNQLVDRPAEHIEHRVKDDNEA